MCLGLFLRYTACCLALTWVAISFSPAGQADSDSKEHKHFPESAKDALLKMMRSKAGKDLGWFNDSIADEMAKIGIEAEKDGWYAWTAAFRFNLAKTSYTLVVRPKPGARACVFEYEGSFVR